MMVRAVGVTRRLLRRGGFDIVRYPLGTDYGGTLQRLVRRLRIDCVLDVGAGDGDSGAMLRALGYAGRIVSFEPSASNYETLSRRAVGDDEWRAVRLALSDRSGGAPFHVPVNPGLSSLRPLTLFGRAAHAENVAESHVEHVEVAALADIWEEYVQSDARVLLKVDAQGDDLRVLEGAGAFLDRVLAVQVELATRQSYEEQADYLDVLAFLRDRSFAPVGFFKVFRDEDRRLVEFDCLLARAAS